MCRIWPHREIGSNQPNSVPNGIRVLARRRRQLFFLPRTNSPNAVSDRKTNILPKGPAFSGASLALSPRRIGNERWPRPGLLLPSPDQLFPDPLSLCHNLREQLRGGSQVDRYLRLVRWDDCAVHRDGRIGELSHSCAAPRWCVVVEPFRNRSDSWTSCRGRCQPRCLVAVLGCEAGRDSSDHRPI